jgi:endonuclease YncB( thermonuclease family)
MVRIVRHALAALAACLLLGLALAGAPAAARSFEADVLRVKDGDSLVVREVRTRRVHEIRLAGIDAPELGQPWGIQARTALKRMVEGQTVEVDVVDRDRYGRLVARVWRGRAYVNAAMTEAGHAWAYGRNRPDPAIRAGHDAARRAGRGLWSLPPEQRIPPATWRARNASR